MTDRQRQFLALYQRHRLEDQLAYYQLRSSELEAAIEQWNAVAAIVMIAASVAAFGASARLGSTAVPWVILATVLPALAAGIASYQRLVAYERTAKVFRDAAAALTSLRLDVTADESDAELEARVERYVQRVERVFQREQGQWGQLLAQVQLDERSAGADRSPGQRPPA